MKLLLPSPYMLIIIWMMISQKRDFVMVCTAFATPRTVRSSHHGVLRSDQTEVHHSPQPLLAPPLLPPPPCHRSVSSSSSASKLYMVGGTSIMDRLTRVVKSNVNKWVSNIENPEKVINQSVSDLQNDLVKVRQSYAEALASQRRIQRQFDEADRVANEWYNRAQLALRQQQKQNGPNSLDYSKNERLAREALLRRETELERKAMVQKQLDTQTMATDQLYNAIVTLEQQIREVMSKQQQLVARARTAEATKQIQSMILGQFDTTTALSNSMNAFTRMEQKVEAMEAAVEASIELNQMQWSTSVLTAVPDVVGITSKNTKRSLEDDFRYLEQSSKIDEELEYLKNKLNTAAIGPASISSNSEAVSFIPIESGEQQKRGVSIPISRREERLSIL